MRYQLKELGWTLITLKTLYFQTMWTGHQVPYKSEKMRKYLDTRIDKNC